MSQNNRSNGGLRLYQPPTFDAPKIMLLAMMTFILVLLAQGQLFAGRLDVENPNALFWNVAGIVWVAFLSALLVAMRLNRRAMAIYRPMREAFEQDYDEYLGRMSREALYEAIAVERMNTRTWVRIREHLAKRNS